MSVLELTATETDTALKQSVQVKPDGDQAPGLAWYSERGEWLPARGTHARQRALNRWYYHDTQWMARGAIAGIAKKIAALPWEISGRDDVEQWRNLLLSANFGMGWSHFIQQVVSSYLRFDSGATIEVIAPGNVNRAPTQTVTGLAVLDPLRVVPTGDPRKPVLYYDLQNGKHLLPYGRVLQLVDTPDTDETIHFGDCALARAIGVAKQQLDQMRYISAFLDDQPPPGFAVFNNIAKNQIGQTFRNYRDEQDGDIPPEWGRTVRLYSLDSSAPVSVSFSTFQQAPEKFDYKVYTELDVNALALALGVDVQELWQLSTGSMGSGSQSEILHHKSRGKTIGLLIIDLERTINMVLPEDVTFAFKYRDEEEARSEADKAQVWAGVFNQIKGSLTPDEQRLFLANNIDAVREAMTDDDGNLRTDDVSDDDNQVDKVVDDTETNTQTTQVPVDAPQADATKALSTTEVEFKARFTAILSEIQQGTLDRRRAGILLRGLIQRTGAAAYRDGLADGGVTDEMTEADNARIKALLAQQSPYVSQLTREILINDNVTPAQAAIKPTLWWNKSVLPFYDAGRMSADKNGMYEFTGEDGQENCATCRRLKRSSNGDPHRHRLSTWAKHRLRPRVDTPEYECGGWQCKHYLIKTTLPANGNLNSVPRGTKACGCATH